MSILELASLNMFSNCSVSTEHKLPESFPPALVTQLEHSALLSKNSHRAAVKSLFLHLGWGKTKERPRFKQRVASKALQALPSSHRFHFTMILSCTEWGKMKKQLWFSSCSPPAPGVTQQLGSVTSKQALSNVTSARNTAHLSSPHLHNNVAKRTQSNNNACKINHMYNLTTKGGWQWMASKRQSCHQVCNTFHSTKSLFPGTARHQQRAYKPTNVKTHQLSDCTVRWLLRAYPGSWAASENHQHNTHQLTESIA